MGVMISFQKTKHHHLLRQDLFPKTKHHHLLRQDLFPKTKQSTLGDHHLLRHDPFPKTKYHHLLRQDLFPKTKQSTPGDHRISSTTSSGSLSENEAEHTWRPQDIINYFVRISFRKRSRVHLETIRSGSQYRR